MPQKNTCSTNKHRWTSQQDAQDALDRIQEKPAKTNQMYQPTAIYKCRKCGGYHLTSRPMKPWKHGKHSPSRAR
jgi:hypothetical protein